MRKEQFNGVFFDGRIDENYEENCKMYLSSLPAANLPFNCTSLRVLPQDIKLIHTDKPSTNYKSGSLICLRNIEHDLRYVRNINSELRLEEGNLVFRCLNEGGSRIFKVKLVNFKETK